MDPPPPPSRDEAPAEKRPLDAADDTEEVAAKKQRLADPSSPIDPKDVLKCGDEKMGRSRGLENDSRLSSLVS